MVTRRQSLSNKLNFAYTSRELRIVTRDLNIQIGEGEPNRNAAHLTVSNVEPSAGGKQGQNNNGQILWFRGLNRIQQQVTSITLNFKLILTQIEISLEGK